MGDPGPSSEYYASFPSTSAGPILPPSPPGSPLLSPTLSSAETLESFAVDSLYTVFNLPRSASDSEIRDRYRSLASTYHPDRQRDEPSRSAAHGRFTQIQRAYEILTDDTKRTIYDLFGEEGLRTSWEVGPRIKSREEMRRHFQRQAYDKRQLDVEALVKPKGSIAVVLDARATLLSASDFKHPERYSFDLLSRLSRFRIGRVSMNHSFETPLNEQTQLVCQGQMITRNGQGGANVVGTIRHQFSPRLWVEVGTTLLNPFVTTANGTFAYGEHNFITVNAVQQPYTAPPRVSVTLGRKLYQTTTGFIVFRSGYFTLGSWGASLPKEVTLSDRSGLSVGLTTSKRNGSGWTVETQVGENENDCNLSSDWSTRVLGVKVQIGATASADGGVSGFVAAERKVTTTVRGGITVSAELGGGISMRLRLSRLGQRLTLPILLSHEFNPYVAFVSTVLPVTSYAALHYFYIVPRKRRQLAARVKELREEHADYIVLKRAEAEEALVVMERPTAAKTAAEREKHGLIIISAHYGLASVFTSRGMKEHEGDEEVVIDVTVPVQALVMNSRIYVPGGRAKFNLLGFWDPCIGENKKLRVRYLFRDNLHEVTVDDVSPLRMPIQTHALDAR